jgi:hypothetical protein
MSELGETCVLTKDLFVIGKRLKEHKMKADEGGILNFFLPTILPLILLLFHPYVGLPVLISLFTAVVLSPLHHVSFFPTWLSYLA